ncbi:MAG: hypothetical protein IJN54_16725 [Lachnospiraceae bacterium]|nr:hypothetical protein [Lachnospiraceae bacterium]
MQKILRKRIFRDLKENFWRYLALGFLIILGMYIIVSLVAAAETIISGTQKVAKEHELEDGQFGVFVPLSVTEEKELTSQGITLEKMFYLDFLQEDESTLRVYKNREQINLLALDEGKQAESSNEIVMEKRYAKEHGLHVGDSIAVAESDFEIVGIGSVPDYDAPYREFSDSAVDSGSFGLAFVTSETYENLKAGEKSSRTESYYYAYQLNDKMTDDELKKELKSFEFSAEEIVDTNLTMFLKAVDNPRIGAAGDDQIINKMCGLVAGVIVMILFTYVISVFVIHGIEKECSVIGALYALGVKRKDLISHYLMLPVTVTFLAGIIGTVLGFSDMGVPTQMADCYGYFSIPVLDIMYPAYLIVYSVIMPPVVAAVVNYFVIRKHLSRTALSLIRNEQKESRRRNINLGNMGYVRRFQIRQMLREARTGFTVIFGMFIALLIMMLGINCYVMVTNLSKETEEDTKFEYMYTYKYPEETVPEGGTEAFAYSLKREIFGYNLEVTLLGITEENPYFDAKVEEGENKVVLSSAAAQKYQLEIGDEIVLKDEEEDRNYAFTVTDIVQYMPSLYVFMDIDSMRALFGEEEDYYNVVFSDDELEIPSGRLYATTTREEIIHSSAVFIEMMAPMITMMCTVAVLIFCVVMYLMMKVMIDRSAFGISLIKIFGYRAKEIRKLYLNGNLFIVVIGAFFSIPLAKKVMDVLYPYMVSNVACGMNLTFSLKLYGIIFGAVILLYFIINPLLVRRVKKIVPAEVLKNRE